MGILTDLGATLGIGAMKVRVTAPKQICAGETLEGVVQIVGGKVDQQAQGLTVLLQLAWETEDDEGRKQTRYSTVLQDRIALAQTIAADSVHELPFALPLPAGLALAPRDHWHVVSAEVDIPSAVNAAGSSHIRMYPAPPLGPLLQAVTRDLGWLLSDFDDEHAPAGHVRALFTPPKSLQPRFDRMRIDVIALAGGFHGQAMLDLKEGLWRALTKKDERFLDFQAPDADTVLQRLQAFVAEWSAAG